MEWEGRGKKDKSRMERSGTADAEADGDGDRDRDGALWERGMARNREGKERKEIQGMPGEGKGS